MEEVESKIIDYKDIKLKIIKRKDGEFIFEYIPEKKTTTVLRCFCRNDSERAIEKFYLNIKHGTYGPLS